VFRGNAKIAERVGVRLRTSLNAIVEEPCPSDLNALLRELDARAAHDRELPRYVSLNERLLQLKKVD
jgi:hypothetical protein